MNKQDLNNNQNVIYELNHSARIVPDFNLEKFGFNRRQGETLLESAKRVLNDDYAYKSKDYASVQVCPQHAKE